MTVVAAKKAKNEFYGGYNPWDEVEHEQYGRGIVAYFGKQQNELYVLFGEKVKLVPISSLKLIKRVIKVIEPNKELYGGFSIGQSVMHPIHGAGCISGFSPFNQDEVSVQFRNGIKKLIHHQELELTGPTNKMFYKGKLRDLRGLPYIE